MNARFLFLSILFGIIFVLTILIAILFNYPAWWMYALIYVFLYIIWYKPMLVFYHSYQARHMLKERNFEGVSQEYEKMAALKKNEGYGDFALGMAHYYRNEWQHAEPALNRALDRGIKTHKKSVEPLALMILLAIYMEKGRRHKAKEMLQELEDKMQAKNGISPKVRVLFAAMKGEWLFRLGEEDEALNVFRAAYENDRDMLGDEAYYYAILLHQKGDKELAVQILNEMLQDEQRWKLFRVREEQVANLRDQLS